MVSKLLDLYHIDGLQALRVFDNLELHGIPLGKRLITLTRDSRVVDENVRPFLTGEGYKSVSASCWRCNCLVRLRRI